MYFRGQQIWYLAQYFLRAIYITVLFNLTFTSIVQINYLHVLKYYLYTVYLISRQLNDKLRPALNLYFDDRGLVIARVCLCFTVQALLRMRNLCLHGCRATQHWHVLEDLALPPTHSFHKLSCYFRSFTVFCLKC